MSYKSIVKLTLTFSRRTFVCSFVVCITDNLMSYMCVYILYIYLLFILLFLQTSFDQELDLYNWFVQTCFMIGRHNLLILFSKLVESIASLTKKKLKNIRHSS